MAKGHCTVNIQIFFIPKLAWPRILGSTIRQSTSVLHHCSIYCAPSSAMDLRYIKMVRSPQVTFEMSFKKAIDENIAN